MKKDFVQSIIDVGSGFLIAILIQIFIFPLFDLYPSVVDSLGFASVFTIVSIVRSAVWRWLFRNLNIFNNVRY